MKKITGFVCLSVCITGIWYIKYVCHMHLNGIRNACVCVTNGCIYLLWWRWEGMRELGNLEALNNFIFLYFRTNKNSSLICIYSKSENNPSTHVWWWYFLCASGHDLWPCTSRAFLFLLLDLLSTFRVKPVKVSAELGDEHVRNTKPVPSVDLCSLALVSLICLPSRSNAFQLLWWSG